MRTLTLTLIVALAACDETDDVGEAWDEAAGATARETGRLEPGLYAAELLLADSTCVGLRPDDLLDDVQLLWLDPERFVVVDAVGAHSRLCAEDDDGQVTCDAAGEPVPFGPDGGWSGTLEVVSFEPTSEVSWVEVDAVRVGCRGLSCRDMPTLDRQIPCKATVTRRFTQL